MASVNTVKLDSLQGAFEDMEKVSNEHDKRILENRKDIVSVQKDVLQNAINIKSLLKV